jgi:hypothetical protein
MDPSDSSVLYAGTEEGLFKSTDGAGSWTKLPTIDGGGFFVYVDPASPSTIYSIYGVTDAIRVQRSDDGGATWVDLNHPSTPKINGYLFDIWFVTTSTPSAVYTWGQNGAYVGRSTDRGETWIRLSAEEWEQAAALRNASRPISPAAQQALDAFLVSTGGFLGGFVTDADTGSWVKANDTGPDAVIIDPDHPAIFYLAAKEGVYKSVDGGGTWQKASVGLF